MARPKLKTRVKGHRRKGYVRRGGIRVSSSYVDPHRREIEDRGEKGRTPKRKRWFEPIGKLDGWGIDKSDTERHKILDKVVKRDGYATTIRRLNALKNVSTNRKTDRTTTEDMNYLRRKYR